MRVAVKVVLRAERKALLFGFSVVFIVFPENDKEAVTIDVSITRIREQAVRSCHGSVLVVEILSLAFHRILGVRDVGAVLVLVGESVPRSNLPNVSIGGAS